MHRTLRNAAAAAAALGVAAAAGGCAASGSVPAKPVAAVAAHTTEPVTAPTTPPPTTSVPTTPPTTAAPTAPPTTPAAKPSAPSNSNGQNSNGPAAQGVPCSAAAVACVSLSKQEAWLLHDGQVVYGPVRVATGRPSLPTPAGTFHVQYKVRDSWSVPYQSWMPWAVYFYEGDAFHEDPVTVRSHGCVHLSATNAEYFYNYLHDGDEVQIVH